MKIIKTLFKFKLIFIILCFSAVVFGNDKCKAKDNCQECLEADYFCTWCTDKNFNKTASRCMTFVNLTNANCSDENIIQNDQKMDLVMNNPNQDYEIDAEKQHAKAIQVRPQKIKMKLVKGKPQQFEMTYRLAKDYPLDLYFLMDLTWSMTDDKETLFKLGQELTTTLKSLTNNYRFGFGSFADKPGMPIYPSDKFKENPCSYEKETCKPTYDFKHHLALTKDINAFIKTVNDSEITGNLENLEGQLDALMQVIVCTDKIGWSNDARKVVLLATDGYMHLAGDGLLLGVTEKNDKKCHLNKDGLYDHDLILDYPSIEEIYWELLKQKVNVIFAVEKDVSSHYFKMYDLMKEVTAVEILSSNSSNILDLVRRAYESLIKKVQFQDISPDIISVKYFTNCNGRYDTLQEIKLCDNIKLGEEIIFYINITLEEYPTDNNWTHVIKIEEPGLSESVEIQVEIQKPCPCDESPITDETGRLPCHGHGHLQCGMCKCDENWLGTTCLCNSENYNSNQALEDQCRLPRQNGKLGAVCSNHAQCICGKCQCDNSKYEGKYCEIKKCKDPKCIDEIEECQAGNCICKYGWKKYRAKCCVKPKNGCINPINKTKCSNNGDCDECDDKCSCKDGFLGKYCEFDKSKEKMLSQGLCENYEPCVKYLKYIETDQKTSETKETVCKDSKGNFYLDETVKELSGLNGKCFTRIDLEYNENKVACDLHYEYIIDEQDISHLKIEEKNCKPQDPLVIGGFIGIGTFIIGILGILLFRLWTYIKDKKEFDKFHHEVNKTIEGGKFNEGNPLYKNPVIQYSIPKLDEE